MTPLPGGDSRVVLLRVTFPSGNNATYAWRVVRGVVVGTNADHEAILEPLIETEPAVDEGAAEITFEFDGWHSSLGVEGAILFLTATDPTGTVVLDRMVDGDGDVERLPPGDYTISAYYRPCDGSCAVLDPAQAFCSLQRSVEADRTHRLTVANDGCSMS